MFAFSGEQIDLIPSTYVVDFSYMLASWLELRS
jgi:hypothetical protein